MIFLTNNINWHLLQFESYQSRRIVRSPLAAETLALADACILIQHDLHAISGRKFTITLLTDEKSPFDFIAKGSDPSEKRLMIDIAAARQAYDQEEINDLGWIRRDCNVSDSMTKIAVNKIMKKFILTGKIEYVTEQFVIRTPKDKNSFHRKIKGVRMLKRKYIAK